MKAKKIINQRENIVDEVLQGFIKSQHGRLKLIGDGKVVARVEMEEKVQCGYCKIELAYQSSTLSMLQHLNRKQNGPSTSH